jgi:hypothetical protein
MHIYLRKSNDDLLSHCRCEPTDALISSPGQLDCPWCGCGWLFTCSRCRMAFTFAQGVEIDESWEETGERDIRALYQRDPRPGEVEQWVDYLQDLLKRVRPGKKHVYVYFDGHVIAAGARGLTIEGWHSYHSLDFIPQVAALKQPSLLDSLLGSRGYWQSKRVIRSDT